MEIADVLKILRDCYDKRFLSEFSGTDDNRLFALHTALLEALNDTIMRIEKGE